MEDMINKKKREKRKMLRMNKQIDEGQTIACDNLFWCADVELFIVH